MAIHRYIIFEIKQRGVLFHCMYSFSLPDSLFFIDYSTNWHPTWWEKYKIWMVINNSILLCILINFCRFSIVVSLSLFVARRPHLWSNCMLGYWSYLCFLTFLSQSLSITVLDMQKNMNKRPWFAYQLKDYIQNNNTNIDSEFIRSVIQKELDMFFNIVYCPIDKWYMISMFIAVGTPTLYGYELCSSKMRMEKSVFCPILLLSFIWYITSGFWLLLL